MTEQRANYSVNGSDVGLTTGRSAWQDADEAADFAPWPDGDDYTWDCGHDGSNCAWYDDDTALSYEAKLQQAERTIAELRGEMEQQRTLTTAAIIVVAFVTSAITGVAGVALGWAARGWLP